MTTRTATAKTTAKAKGCAMRSLSDVSISIVVKRVKLPCNYISFGFRDIGCVGA
jgi:hypothetical protein